MGRSIYKQIQIWDISKITFNLFRTNIHLKKKHTLFYKNKKNDIYANATTTAIKKETKAHI